MALKTNLGASLSQGYSSGGSQNSAWSMSDSGSTSMSNSYTDAMSARQWSALMADIAWQRDMDAMHEQMDFNSAEAQKVRDWQEQMANTIYTRSAKNMREAGINPILAANMGLSGASVGSGATASLGGTPSAPLAQSFMDSWSASSANSWGTGRSESEGSSWNSSENGLVTALTALGTMITSALESVNASQKIEIAIDGLKDLAGDKVKDVKEWFGDKKQKIENASGFQTVARFGEKIKDLITGYDSYRGSGGGRSF